MTDTDKATASSQATPAAHPGETELKLTIDAAAVPTLLRHPLLRAQRPKRQLLRNTYYDTPDLSLMKAKVAVRERWVGKTCLLTVKTAGVSVGGLSRRLEWEAPTQPGQFDFATLVTDEAVATHLSSIAWQLVPVFRTDFHRRTWMLEHEGASIEVALDEGSITTGGRSTQGAKTEATLRDPISELELELKSGPASALRSLALLLMHAPITRSGKAAPVLPEHASVALRPEDRSKAQRGLALFTGARPLPIKLPAKALDANGSARQAFALLAGDALLQVQGNVQGLLQCLLVRPDADPDPEFVHQTRVAIRRLRTALRLFEAHLPARAGKAWRQHWSHVASALGDTRNWDMLSADWLPLLTQHAEWTALDAKAKDAWTQWLHAQRQAARTGAVTVLKSPGFAHGLLACQQWLDELVDKDTTRTRKKTGEKTKAKTSALTRWANTAYADAVQRTVRMARRALRHGPEARHELRLKIKALRYTSEQLGSLLPKAKSRQVSVIAAAQTHLGMLNDLDTLRHLLAHAPSPAREVLLQAAETHQTEGLGGLPQLERALLKILPGN